MNKFIRLTEVSKRNPTAKGTDTPMVANVANIESIVVVFHETSQSEFCAICFTSGDSHIVRESYSAVINMLD